MPQQFENPKATILEDETAPKETGKENINRVVEKAAERGTQEEQTYHKNHHIFTK